MNKPIHPLVADMVSKLDAGLREEFEERAAILEFDAAMLRDHAECLALLDVLHRHPDVLSGVAVMHAELYGLPIWCLTTDLNMAHVHIPGEAGIHKLADVLDSRYGGTALLTSIG